MGVVALNRLIARDGQDESILYIVGLMLAAGLSDWHDGRNGIPGEQLYEPPLARHRVQHGRGRDYLVGHEPPHARVLRRREHDRGDIGILTGTARRIHNAVRSNRCTPAPPREEEPYILKMEIEAYDPLEPKKRAPRKAITGAPIKRLPKRHPGISIFYYFSSPPCSSSPSDNGSAQRRYRPRISRQVCLMCLHRIRVVAANAVEPGRPPPILPRTQRPYPPGRWALLARAGFRDDPHRDPRAFRMPAP